MSASSIRAHDFTIENQSMTNQALVDRIAMLERRVAILEGKPDPGMRCNNPECRGGKVDVAEHPRDRQWVYCPTCSGSSVIFPPL